MFTLTLLPTAMGIAYKMIPISTATFVAMGEEPSSQGGSGYGFRSQHHSMVAAERE